LDTNELSLELTPGLEAPAIARAELRTRFGGRISADQLLDLQSAVSELVATAALGNGGGPVHLEVWRIEDELHGRVTEATLATELERRRGEEEGVLFRFLDAITWAWGAEADHAWFVIR
jgi:hypothetical protein